MLEFGASILDGEWPNLPWSHWASYWMARRRPRIYDARCDRAGGLRVASTPRLPHLLHRSRVKNVAIGVSGMMAKRDSTAPVNLSITHNSCADRGAQPDIGETGQAAPHHDVPRRRIIGAREVSA